MLLLDFYVILKSVAFIVCTAENFTGHPYVEPFTI